MIRFSTPLVEGKLIKRYKRFFADVELLDGQVVTSHCPNTGSMRTCGSPGDRVFLLKNDDPKRKLKYTWEYTEATGGFIGVNTQRPNRIVEDAISEGLVEELKGYSAIKREAKYGENSKIDLLLTHEQRPPCYVEIKNVTLIEGAQLLFPDAVTTRGQKHLKELMEVKSQGCRAVMFFLINRPDGQEFAPATAIDPHYSELLQEASESGVEIITYRTDSRLEGMALGQKVPHHIHSERNP